MITKVRSVVFASLYPGTIDIHVAFGYGMNDGGGLVRVNRNQVPVDCRMPNTLCWVTLNKGQIESIEKMTVKEMLQNKIGEWAGPSS